MGPHLTGGAVVSPCGVSTSVVFVGLGATSDTKGAEVGSGEGSSRRQLSSSDGRGGDGEEVGPGTRGCGGKSGSRTGHGAPMITVAGTRRRRLCLPVVAIRRDEGRDEPPQNSTLRRQFDEFDRNRSGAIGEEELRRAVEKLRLPVSRKDVKEYVQKAGGRVTFDQFAEFTRGLEDRLHATFKELDKRQRGVVSKEVIPEALKRFNLPPRKVYQDDRLVSASVGKPPSEGFGFEDLRKYLLWARDAEEVVGSPARAGTAIDFGGDFDCNLPLALEKRGVMPNLRFPEVRTMRDVVAASISGAVARTVVGPLERMRIMQMVDPSLARQDPRVLLNRIRTAEGDRGLLRGNLLNVLRLYPAKLVEALVYRALTNRFDPTRQGTAGPAKKRGGADAAEGQRRQGWMMPDWQRNAIATLASTAGILTSYPIDTLRVAVQAPIRGLGAAAGAVTEAVRDTVGGVGGNGGRGVGGAGTPGTGGRGVGVVAGADGRGAGDIGRAIMRRRGVRGFYDGIAPQILRTIPYFILSGYAFSTVERWYKKRQGRADAEPGPVAIVLIATAAALCAQTALYPLETVQRRMQLQAAMGPAAGRVYSGMMDAVREIIRREGVGALYGGLAVNNLKLLPAAAVSFAIHNSARNLCDAY
ncbi:hypothetical protein CBR_g29993 [Chara braunii]|uniref:EF-hand domain-containing protein n=1 Tax=Chara braunii TaxID=69332 RepID=A0A388LBP0_CHABU|nr:hypothetical protein CBR_g29993 [Chara braunii]|eukprot:GBG79729.1 hypothetical protein CBR_g29993 [Chara braunii]